jgi:O-antigen/teichoic acid export membrane protein
MSLKKRILFFWNSKIKNKEFAKNSISGGLLFLLLTIITLVSYPIIINKLGLEIYGLWVAVSIVVSLSQLGDMGLNDGVLMKISESLVLKDFRKTKQITASFFIFILIISLIISLLIFLSKDLIISFFNIKEEYSTLISKLFFWMVFMIPIILIGNYFKAVLLGLGKYTYANYSFILLRLIQVLISILLLFCGFEVWSLVIANYCFFSISILVYLFYIYKFGGKINLKYFSLITLKEVLSYGSQIFISKIIQKFFIDELIKIFLTKYYGLDVVGSFDIAFKMIRLVRSFFDHTMKPAINEVTKIVKKSPQKANKFVLSLQKKIILPIVPFIILLIFFAEFLFKFWLGNGYNDLILIFFRILMIAYIINLFAIPAYNGLLGGGFSKEIIISTAISIIIMLLGIIFITSIKKNVSNLDPIILYAFMISINSTYLIYIFNKKVNTQ